MTGHIKLGTVAEDLAGTMRNYQLYRDVTDGWKRYGLNPQAPKVASGSKNYEDEENWEYWVQEDWSQGAGKLQPHKNSGYMWGSLDSRVPGQLILPPHWRFLNKQAAGVAPSWGQVHLPHDGEPTVETLVGGSGSIQRICHEIDIKQSQPVFIHYLVKVTEATHITLQCGADFPGGSVIPDNSYGGGAEIYIAPEHGEGYYWISGEISHPVDVQHYAMIFPSTGWPDPGFYVLGSTATNATWEQIGGAWAKTGDYKPFFYASGNTDQDTGYYGQTQPFARFNSTIYHAAGNGIIKGSDGDDGWQVVGTVGASQMIQCLVPFKDKLYVGVDDWTFAATKFYTVTTGDVIAADATYEGALFCKWNGYLYKAKDNIVSYSNDGTTWVDVTAAPSDEAITGIVGFQDSVLIATTTGLSMLMPGDFVVGVTPWNTILTGTSYLPYTPMINWNGSVFIIVNNRLLRYSQTGSIDDIWFTTDENLSEGLGVPIGLGASTHFLFVLSYPENTSFSHPFLWNFDGKAWHPLARMPSAPITSSAHEYNVPIYYDKKTSYVFFSLPWDEGTYSMWIPDFTLNPYNSSSSRYAPSGWIEWDDFMGGINELDKDYESVTLLTENCTSTTPISVYWRDDDSTGWEKLGTATADNSTLRWSDYTTRPSTKAFRLGIEMRSKSNTSTPRIRSIIVRFRTKTRDRYGWRIKILVSTPQAQVDGTDASTYTVAQQMAHLDALQTQTPPFVFQDIDGNKYEVDCVDYNQDVIKYDYKNSAADYQVVYNWVLEQVTTGTRA